MSLTTLLGNPKPDVTDRAGRALGAVSLASTTVTGTVAVTESGTWTVQPGNTANTTPWVTQSNAAAAGGATPTKIVSAASTNATSVKGSAGSVYSIVLGNTNASPRFVKLYDKASAPTVGTDVPVQTFVVPGNANGAGAVIDLDVPLKFTNGIALAITAAMADTDATAIGANEVVVSLSTA